MNQERTKWQELRTKDLHVVQSPDAPALSSDRGVRLRDFALRNGQLYPVGCRPAAQAAIRAPLAAQRSYRRAFSRPFDADRTRAVVVSRRLEKREAWTDRVRPLVRAPHVQRL